MSSVIQLPERNMNPPAEEKAYCEKCEADAIEAWPMSGSVFMCRAHALQGLADSTLQSDFVGPDLPSLILMRDVLTASLEACERRLMKLTGGVWAASQKK